MSSSNSVVFLASGRGSNVEAILKNWEAGKLDIDPVLILTDNAEAGVLQVAKEYGIESKVVPPNDGQIRAEYDSFLLPEIANCDPDWIVCAGYMRLLSRVITSPYKNRIVNIHPSLLPSFPGLHAVRQALDAGVALSGVTVHFVDEGVDTGPIILQRAVDVMSSDTEETLTHRIQAEEHLAYTEALQLVISGSVQLQNQKVIRPVERNALISVSDKEGLPALVTYLGEQNYRIFSTGGTARYIRDLGVDVTDVSDLTGAPEMLDGRVKTLHPAVFGGILARRDSPSDMKEIALNRIPPMDLVVVNLYPFARGVSYKLGDDPTMEYIDIGGVTLLRAAAKNWKHVAVLHDPKAYQRFISIGSFPDADWRREAAGAVFHHTYRYDISIARYFSKYPDFPECFVEDVSKVSDLRYGENPHQKAALYSRNTGGLADSCEILQGKEMSYNNYLDADAAWDVMSSYGRSSPAAVIVKHGNPTGVGTSESMVEAFDLALEGDPVSAFGGILAVNMTVKEDLVDRIAEHKLFLEIIIAPGFNSCALEKLSKKKNLRVVKFEDFWESKALDVRSISGGLLVQEADYPEHFELDVVTERDPTMSELKNMRFAWMAVRAVKSNAIVLARDKRLVGVGAGQMSRIDSVDLAGRKAGDNAVGSAMASDAFFPFDDCVRRARKLGVTAIVQPGGSKRDQDSIDAANELGITMAFTGRRHFRH